MSGAVVLDGRCSPLRRDLGPVAWMILEEAALRALASEGGSLWVPLSIRSAAAATGIGRESAARAITSLVAAGLLRRTGDRRGVGGRFVAGGYWLMAPAGLAVSGAAERAVSGDPDSGGPCPVVAAMVPAGVVTGGRVGAGGGGRGGSRRGQPVPGVGGQASLFAGAGEKGVEHAAAGSTPRMGVESVGAVSSVGCEVVEGVHELAPGVPAAADPSLNPYPVTSGAAGC